MLRSEFHFPTRTLEQRNCQQNLRLAWSLEFCGVSFAARLLWLSLILVSPFLKISTSRASSLPATPPTAPSPPANKPDRTNPRNSTPSTTDFSRQIIVIGPEASIRSRFVSAAQQIRQQTLAILAQPSARYPTARPILIALTPVKTLQRNHAQAPLQIEDPAGLKIQITLPDSTEPESRFFRKLFVHSLLLELALRSPSANKSDTPPRWMIDAILDRLDPSSGTENSEHLQPLLKSGQIPILDDILSRLDADPIPSSARDEAVARCLLNLLVDQPGCGPGFLGLLQNREKSGSHSARLLRLFPSLAANDLELQRVWTLHLASQATRRERIQLDWEQTQRDIRKLLEISVLPPEANAPRTFQLEQFSEFVRLPGIKEILRARHLEFSSLLARAHFYYTEPIQIYAGVCQSLSEGQTRGLAEQLQRAQQLSQSATASLERVRDYLNWFEAEKLPRSNPRFEELYRLWDSQPQPPKNPKVSRALDEWEERLKREKEDADLKGALEEASSREKQKAAPRENPGKAGSSTGSNERERP